MRHRFTGDQALLLHQGQHTRGGGPGDAEFLFDGVLVDFTIPVTSQEHDDMRVAAGGLLGGKRHALTEIAVDGFGYRAHFDAENMLIHCPPYHARPCAYAPSPHIVAYATIHDQDPNNGGNSNIIIEDCTYGFCHGALTCGSESIHNRNIILRRIHITNANRLLWLKMRPDTPQQYEYILVEDITGDADHFLYIKPWTQFFDLKDRKDIPVSYSNHVTMRNIDFKCDNFFSVEKSDQYQLTNFTFENLNIKAKNGECDKEMIDNFIWKKVSINNIK